MSLIFPMNNRGARLTSRGVTDMEFEAFTKVDLLVDGILERQVDSITKCLTIANFVVAVSPLILLGYIL